MSAWIGPLGNLIEFKCPSAVESTSDDPHVYFRPLGGSVAATKLGDGTRPRVWEARVSAARPDHVSALSGLASGEWGHGPFVFIPPAAETLNLLGQRDALAMGTPSDRYVTDGPGVPVATTEGVAGTSYGHIATGPPYFMALGTAPVIPGVPVTGRAWLQAPAGELAKIRTRFFTAGHAELPESPTITTGSVTGEFLHVTTIAPDTAAYAVLEAGGAIITRPSLTWTAEPRTWSESAASTNIIMSSLAQTTRRATGEVGAETIADYAFTVQELTP